MLTLLAKALAYLSLPMIHRLGTAMGWLLHVCTPVSARIQRENLKQSGLCANKKALQRVVQANIAETGKSALETLAIWQWSQEKVLPLVKTCHNWHLVKDALARGKGLIFLTPHMGCFEITSIYYAARHPITVLFRPPKKSWLAPLIDMGRSKGQIKLAPANVQGVRALMQALKKGEAIGILPDQIPNEGDGEWADFFGKPAYTMTLAGKLAEKTGATVLMAFGERLANGQGYEIHLSAVETIATPTLLNKAVTECIAQKPEQYLWQYNRYKIRRGSQKKQIELS
ncbi:MAG: lysophospholipid acyltransferase family protein [Methylotenera sp.]|nr:lysophospholipid acyltransferase family protein [Methylotenera sp.]